MKMKSIDLFCASPASTAICTSMDQKAIIRHGIRSIDRHIHRLGGETPLSRRSNAAPCSSHIPFDPSARRKSCDDRPTYLLTDKSLLLSDSTKDNRRRRNMNPDAFRSLSTRPYQSPLYNPSSNSRHHLNNPAAAAANKSPSSPPSNHQQVIELRVSIHCKGCEGKLRKHISRMEGVTSFSIDLATKKVTVIGDVTPLSVLTSISKVKKNAQFWPSPTSSSSSSFSSPSPARLSLSTS